ncbi:MAG: regulator of sigma protease [Campylobacterota bacterium]|nr:regulator of sigma protease [Campylobacterota bacterium]
MSILVSLLVLSVLVFIHELGHFLAARITGVRVEVFSIGFGSKLFSKKIGQTEYRLAAIPLGGYVKMKGQDDIDPLKKSFDNDSYNVKNPFQKIFILLAGPFANFFIAFIFYLIVAWSGSQTLGTTIGEVLDNSPAKSAGLMKNDKIIMIDGKNIKSWGEVGEYIQTTQGTVTIAIERNGAQQLVFLTPEYKTVKNIFGEDIKRMMIGIAASDELITINYGFIEGMDVALDQTIQASMLIIKGVEKLITGVVSADNIGGVFSIVDYTAKASEAGVATLLIFAALMSVNFGVLNLLPIPALDGGHIMFNLYEIITRKQPSEKALYNLTIIGWMLLFGLMFLGLYNDINRLFID